MTEAQAEYIKSLENNNDISNIVVKETKNGWLTVEFKNLKDRTETKTIIDNRCFVRSCWRKTNKGLFRISNFCLGDV